VEVKEVEIIFVAKFAFVCLCVLLEQKVVVVVV
jgi:hypothetical protein